MTVRFNTDFHVTEFKRTILGCVNNLFGEIHISILHNNVSVGAKLIQNSSFLHSKPIVISSASSLQVSNDYLSGDWFAFGL